jgi:hypothetical protein
MHIKIFSVKSGLIIISHIVIRQLLIYLIAEDDVEHELLLNCDKILHFCVHGG